MTSATTAFAVLAAVGLCFGRDPADRAVKPVIHGAPEERYGAMRSASLIVLAEVTKYRLITGPRDAPKPEDVPGVNGPTVPLHLARVSAKVLVALRGKRRRSITFYSWVWNSGKHGGPRLFHPYPGSSHVLFLRQEGGYLHTVGDYLGYDLEIPRSWTPTLIAELGQNPPGSADLFERLTTAVIRADLLAIRTWRFNWSRNMLDLAGLTSPFYVAGQLDDFCRGFPNPFGRFSACSFTAREFAGRCAAYRIARELPPGELAVRFGKQYENCVDGERDRIEWLRRHNWPVRLFDWGWRPTPVRRRLAMRLFASAMDPAFRTAACEAASRTPEARDIPECKGPAPSPPVPPVRSSP